MSNGSSHSLVGPAVGHTFWRDLWARTALEGLLVLAAYFGGWELMERTLFGDATFTRLHGLHLVRGVGAALLLGTWSFLRIRRARLDSDDEMRTSMAKLEERVQQRTRELEEARAFTELLFDSLCERIVVIGKDGRVVKANRVAEEVAGRDPVGELATELFADGKDDDGRVWDVETIAVPSAGRDYVIEVGRDVTEAKNLEAQVRHQEKMASLGILTAGFAHDLGNPLASLSTELEMLELEDDVVALRGSLGVLREHVGRMTRTLREMVDFTRRRRDQVADVSIADVVADSIRLVRHDTRWMQIELELDVRPDLPAVHMVEDHLVLVLINLLLNAADAMPSGGTIRVSARRGEGDVVLDITDTGSGMARDVLARAKTPLFSTKGSKGTGLGLSVSESILRSVGGRLDLASTLGEGTRVSVRLPLRSGEHA